MKKVLLLLLTVCMSMAGFSQTHWYSASTGDLNDLATWGSNTDGTGSNPASFGTATTTYHIQNRASATLGGAWVVTQATARIVVGDGVTPTEFIIPSGFSLTGTGALMVLSAQATMTIQNSTNPTTLTSADPTSVVNYDRTGAQTILAGTYGTLNILNDRGGATVTFPNATVAIKGAITVPTGVVYAMGTGTVQYNATGGGQTVLSVIPYRNLTVGLAGGGTTTVDGDLNISGTLTVTTPATLDMGTNAISTATTITLGAAAVLRTQNTSGAPFPSGKAFTSGFLQMDAATGGQTLPGGTYPNLIISHASGGTTTAVGNVLTSTSLNVSATSTLDMGTNSFTGTQTTTTINGTLFTQAPTAAFLTGRTFGGTGTVNYNGSGAQTIMGGTYNCNITVSGARGGADITFENGATVNATGLFTLSATGVGNYVTTGNTFTYGTTAGGRNIYSAIPYNNLTLSNTSGTNTADGNISVANNLTTTAGGTFDLSTFDLTGLAGTVTNGGTLKTFSTANPPIPSGKTWTGTVQFASLTGGQSIPVGTYTRLTSLATSGTNTALGDITLAATASVTVTTGGTVDMGTNQLLGAATALATASAGTLLTQNTGGTPLPSGKTWSFVVNYNNTAAQTIMAGTYSTGLTIGNTSGTSTASGAISVNGTLGTATGGTLDMSTFALGGNPTTITNNGTIRTANTGATPIPSGENWGIAGTVEYSATTGSQTIMTGTYNHLTLDNTSGTNTASNDITVNGTLTTTAGGTFSFANVAYQLLGTVTPVNNGTIQTVCTVIPAIPSGKTWAGTVTFNRVTGNPSLPGGTFDNLNLINTAGSVVATGDVTVNTTLVTTSGGTLAMGTNQLLGAFTATHDGALTTSSTANPAIPTGLDWTGTTGSVTFGVAAGGQFIPAGTYKTLICSNTSGTNTVNGDIDVSTTFTAQSGGILNMGSNLLTGAFTYGGAGTLRTQNTTAAPLPTGKAWTGTINYDNATGGQTIMPGTYTSLTSGNTSNTNTLVGGDISVSGTLTNTPGGTMDLGTNLLTSVGTPAGTGTLATQNLTATPVPSGEAWTGNVTFNAATGAQTVPAGTYATLSLGNTSGTTNAGGALVVNTALNTAAGGTFNMGSNAMTGTMTTITNHGTIQTANTGTPFTTGKNFGGNGTVEYTVAGGGQTIMAATYNHLTLDNTSGTNTASASITVNGTLTTTAGGTFSFGAVGSQLLGATMTVANSGILSTVCTVSPAIPTGKTWGGSVIFARTSGGQSIPAGTFNDLTFSNSTGTQTAVGGPINVNGALITTSGGTLAMGTNQLAGNPSSVTNDGTITTSSTANPAIPSGKTWTGTTGVVTFGAATGGQFIPAGTYKTLTCSNTSGTNTVTGDIAVSTTFTFTGANAAASIDMGTNLLTGAFTAAGTGTLFTQNTTTAPVPTGKTWTGTINYNAATGAQTVMIGTYATLTLGNTSGTSTAEGNLTVGTVLNVTNAGATLDMSTFALAGASSVTNNGLITTDNTGATPFTSGKTYSGTGTIRYNVATGGQTVMAGTYANSLLLMNSSNTNTASGALTVNGTGTLTTTAGGTLNMVTFALAGTGSISNSGTIRTQSTTNPALPAGKTWGGTINYDRATGAQFIPAGTYTNLTFGNTSGTQTAVGALDVSTSLVTTSGGTLAMAAFQLTGAFTPTNNGAITTTSTANPAIPTGHDWTGTTGSVTFAATTGGQFIPAGTYKTLNCSNTSGTNTVNGNIDVSTTFGYTGANTAAITNMGTNLLTGSFATSGTGTLRTQNLTAAPVPTGRTWSGRVNYDATTGGQTVMAGTYTGGLILGNTSGDQTASGNLTINGIITTTTGSTLQMGTNLIAGNPTTITNDGTINTAALATPIPTGENWGGTGTVVYTVAGGGQSVITGTFNGLTMSNTSGTNTASGALTINGTLTTAAGGILNMVTFAMAGSGTPSHAGTIRTQTTGNPAIPSGKTWGGDIIFDRTAGGQFVPAGTYNNLTLSNTSASQTVNGDLTVDGTLTTTSGGTLAMGANQLSGALTGVTNNGTITTSSTANPALPSGKNWTGTTGLVSFNVLAGGQFIPGGTYKTLTCLATSGTNTAVGNITATGTVTANNGAGTLDMGTFDLAAATLTNNASGTIRTQSTSSTPIPSGVALAGTIVYDATTGGQTIVTETSYVNLTISNSSGTNTANGNILVNGNFATGSGTAILDMATFTLGGIPFNITGGGSIRTANTSALPLKTAMSWPQTIEYYNATGGQTIVNGTYNGGLINSNTSGTNTLAAGSASTVNGTLTLSAGSVLADNDVVLTVNGNIAGTGTHNTSTTGRITMTGSGGTISAVTLGNLTLNNAGGFSLTGDAGVNGTLTLTAGRLTIGGNNLTMGTAAPAIAGSPSASNMIVATGAGQVRKMYLGTGSFTFPIGDAGPNYSPLTLDMQSGTLGSVPYAGVNVTAAKHPANNNTTNYLNRYWTVSVNDITTPVYSVTATYVDGDIMGTEASIAGGQYTGSLPWNRFGAVTAAANTLSTTNVSNANSAFSGINGANPTVSVLPATVTICSGGVQSLVASGLGDPTLTYSWAPATGLSATTGASVDVSITTTVAVTQEYTVTVTDGNGFTGTNTATVSVNPVPEISGITTVCTGTFTTLNGTPAGGTWASSHPAVATVGLNTGQVEGIDAGTSNITYTAINGCIDVVQVTVSAALAAITGVTGVCEGGTTTYSHGVAGGTWSSSTPAVATIDLNSGLITTVAPGTTTITYTVGTGCMATKVFSTFDTPDPITGTFFYCETGTAAVYGVPGGGAWTSTNTGVATVELFTGNITAVAPGTSLISYTTSSGCYATQEITVNALPAVIGGGNFCNGSTQLYTNATPGGAWLSTNTSVATIDGTGLATSLTAGGTTIRYTAPNGCYRTKAVTVNPLPAPITGTLVLCPLGSTTLSCATGGGVWSSVTPATATISGGGVVTPVAPGNTVISYTMPTGCARTATVTVNSAPGSSTGTAQMCAGGSTTLVNGTPGGTWSSSNTAKATVVAATGVVTGIATGTANITYATAGSGCYTFTEVTVDAAPAAITGTANACVGQTSTLSHPVPGGTWTSNNAAAATVGLNDGVVTAVSAGVVTITYWVTPSCFATQSFQCKAVPAAITGNLIACVGTTTQLADATVSGSWSSSSTGVAGVNSVTGQVTGAGVGNATITYLMPTGCYVTAELTVNAAPSPITGLSSVCSAGGVITLNATPASGTWTSSNVSLATVNATTGEVTGVSAGNVNITYTQPASGCNIVKAVTVGVVPAAISGPLTICNGSSTTLTNSTGGGTWSSSVPAVASIGSSTGLISAATLGNTTISYHHNGGCVVTAEATVNAGVSATTGDPNLCVGGATTLSNVDMGGTWSSSVPAKAGVGSATGIVTGTTAGTSNITYMITPSCYTTTQVTVAPAPAAITGLTNVCVGYTITLSHAVPGGTWSSSNPAKATVDPVTGVVGGISGGGAVITYVPSNGCFVTKSININTNPAPISGSLAVCAGSTSNLTSGGVGTWSSSNVAAGTIHATNGAMAGIAAGNTTITYRLNGSGCYVTGEATVNPLPDVISGPSTICVASSQLYTSDATPGTWSSTNVSVATIGSLTGIATGVAGGGTTIYYTHDGTGCRRLKAITVNAIPAAITGTLTYCLGGTATLACTTGGGAWSSDGVSATISGGGLVTSTNVGTSLISYTGTNGCARTTTVTVNAALSANTGNDAICIGGTTTLSNTGTPGTWSSSVTAKATVGGTTGIVTGIATGTSNISFTKTGAAGCIAITQVTVNATPAAITGTFSVCAGSVTTLSHPVPGGTWTSSNTGLATVGSSSGDVTGVAAGAPTITYNVSPGCFKTQAVVVNPIPNVISGASTVCIGFTSSNASYPTAGTWTSATPAVATINSTTGLLTGVSSGDVVISYIKNGCLRTATRTVNPNPAAITGTFTAAVAATQTLSDATPGGTWSSSNEAKATVGSSDGVVTGVATGTARISYILPTGCYKTQVFTVTASKPGSNIFFESDRKIVFSVFPNPTHGAFTIQAPARGVFSVYAMDGRKVVEYRVDAELTDVTLPNDLAEGAYMCRFNQENGETILVKLWYQQ